MGHYVNLDLTKGQEILSFYGIENLVEIRPLSLGISNSNYKVSTKDEFFLLKVSNDKNLEQLKKEEKILLYLKEKEFGYALSPFPLKQGGFVYQSHPFFGMVFPFVAGRAPSMTSHSCFEIGEKLALLHLLSLDTSLGFEEFNEIRDCNEVGYDALKVVDYVENCANCPQDFRESFFEIFPDRLLGYRQENFPKGLIHGDLYYDNTLFHNDELVVLLDFEQAGVGEFLFDIGISISGSCLQEGNIDFDLISSFLKGYEKRRVLEGKERTYLYDAILLGLFSIALWRIKRFKEGHLDPKKADSYKELLVRAKNFSVNAAINLE